MNNQVFYVLWIFYTCEFKTAQASLGSTQVFFFSFPCVFLFLGNYFASHFFMGGEKFDTPHPEGYLFGENMDLNFLGNRPVQASSYVLSVLLFFASCLFWKILCRVCRGGWHRPKRPSLLGEGHSNLFRCKLGFPEKLNSPLRLIFT